MRSRSAILVASVAVAVSLAGSAVPASKPDSLELIQRGLAQAVAAGQLDQPTATGYTTIAKRAVAELPTIPPLRAQTLTGMLGDIAAQARSYTGPWALTLFSMLAFNEQELAAHRLPPSGTDAYGDDGILYRFVKGHGFEFHPLAEFGALNTLILAGDTDGAKQLADALVARGELTDGRLLWSYPFPFGTGQPPWRSGMAQAVAAQALARVGQALGDQTLLAAADQAYAAIPGRLVRALPAGPWIELYSFDGSPVLNAQLQSVISIGDYAQISGNTGAAGLAAELQAAAEALLPRFDTGYWSLYSLAGKEAPLSYHDYVVSLLKRLATRTGDTMWTDFATRFQGYETQAPALHLSVAAAPDPAAPIVIYPDPQDGYLDTVTFSFWLSKLSTVTLHAGGRTQSVELGHGSKSIVWSPGRRAAGTYYPYLTAVDASGNSTRLSLRQVVMKALVPPVVDAHIAGRRTLVWSAADDGTPWLHLVVRLDDGTKRRYRDLGHQALSGRIVVLAPPGTWQATLVAGNSARQAVTVDLGSLSGRSAKVAG
jgi:D-glucuronyl C5-epimerase C-terminus